jgi:lipopolysaccharide export system permease protein
MKKILFRKILLDCLLFFFISLISTSIIIWVFQAVNFLDIIVEDGRDFIVYLSYSILNFPKIISKIIPFAIFFSFCFVFNKYEMSNELIILWNFGVHKIELVNFFFKFSIFILLLQTLLTTYIVPGAQGYSRSLIKNSSVDFFESFIKPKKFNDNIVGLTIYSDEKDKNGKLKNIYIKKNTGNKKYQITVAKTGNFTSINDSKILVLYNGQTINLINGKITSFNFSKSDFILSQLDADIIVQKKIQETSTISLINCIQNYFQKDLSIIKNPPEYLTENCSYKSLDTVFQELYKRFLIPFYIPILILVSLLLILKSKENIIFYKYKIVVFLLGFIIIIISESSLKFVENNFYGNLKLISAPFLIILFLYLTFKIKLNMKFKKSKL